VGYDLNTLIPPNGRYYLTNGFGISNNGIIVGEAYDMQTGGFPAFAAIPTGEPLDRTRARVVRPVALPPSVLERIARHWMNRFGPRPPAF
jgi:hypothetical protein